MMSVVTVNGHKYNVTREITPTNMWPKGDFKSKYRFFEANDSVAYKCLILVNYGKYWATGENFYDSAENLESLMFASNRKAFMRIINNDEEQQKILKKSEQIGQVLPLLFPLLNSIKLYKDSRYVPQPTDKIVNEQGEYISVEEKREKYNYGLDNNVKAVSSSNTYIPLGSKGAEFNDVEFICGQWRIQEPFTKKTILARDNLEFVLIKKLPREEHTNFDFYSACLVKNGIHGKFIDKFDNYIIAKRKTSRGEYIAYGKTIADARAFLSIKLFDVYRDIIDTEEKDALCNQK